MNVTFGEIFVIGAIIGLIALLMNINQLARRLGGEETNGDSTEE